MSTAQLAAVSFLARYSARTNDLYAFQLREWFAWCERNGLDPLVGDALSLCEQRESLLVLIGQPKRHSHAWWYQTGITARECPNPRLDTANAGPGSGVGCSNA